MAPDQNGHHFADDILKCLFLKVIFAKIEILYCIFLWKDMSCMDICFRNLCSSWTIWTLMPDVSKRLLTHWGRVTHICFGKLTIIGSDNDLSPGWRQAIIWTNAGILLFGPLGSNFSEILIEIDTFSFKKMHLKLASAKWRPFCLGLNVLNLITHYPQAIWCCDAENDVLYIYACYFHILSHLYIFIDVHCQGQPIVA